MNAKTIKQRVDDLRERRREAGLTRLELYVHPDDHEAIKKKAKQLQRARERKEEQK